MQPESFDSEDIDVQSRVQLHTMDVLHFLLDAPLRLPLLCPEWLRCSAQS